MILIFLLEANNIGNRFRRGLSAGYLPEYVAIFLLFFKGGHSFYFRLSFGHLAVSAAISVWPPLEQKH